MKWQPISTAPRNEPVLVADDSGDHTPVTAMCNHVRGLEPVWEPVGTPSDAGWTLWFTPTHWQPIPPPPVRDIELLREARAMLNGDCDGVENLLSRIDQRLQQEDGNHG